MAADLSKLSTEDLLALKSGDLSKVSTQGLMTLKGQTAPEKQTLHTEDTIYDPVTGVPLSSPSYGPETTGKTDVARKVLTGAAALPISVATGVAKGSGAVGIPQLVTKLLGSNIGDELVNATNQIEKGMEQQGGEYLQKGANIAGQVAPLVMGGMPSAMGSKAAPLGTTSLSEKTMNLANKIPVLPSYAKTFIGNAGTGALATALAPEKTGLTPEEYISEKNIGMATNAALGATLPIVGQGLGWLGNKAYNIGKAVVEPFYKSGREQILGRALREYSGNDVNKAITNLRNAQEIVPGSLPTAGEAAGVPSLAALERTVMATTPEATNALAAKKLAQNEARVNALQAITSPTRVNKYTNLRSEVADNLYEDALNKAMDFSKLGKPLQKEVQSLANTPAIKKAMGEARENALNRGLDIGDPAGSLRGLHETKMALDGQINTVKAKLQRDQAGATSAELDGLVAAKNRLLSFIENSKVSPEYKAARESYARLSKPVEQLETIESLGKKVINPATDTLYPQQFARNLEALKAEGKLSKQQIARLEAINEDLQRTVQAQNAGRGVGSDTVQKLAYANMLNQVNLPNALRRQGLSESVGNLVARGSDLIYGNANKQLKNELAEALLSPSETARLMQISGVTNKGFLTPQQKNIAKLLMMQETNRMNQGE